MKRLSLNQFGRVTRSTLIAVIAIIIGFGVVLFARPDQKNSEAENQPSARQVELISVRDSISKTTPLQVVGTVESKNEARIRTETQGRIVEVYAKLGDTVTAGTVLAGIENNLERAALLQAEGAVEAARANLIKVTGGAREEELEILQASLTNAEKNIAEAKTFAINTIKNSFATADDVVRNRIDPVFSDPQEANPQINFPVKDSQIEINLENGRFLIEGFLKKWSATIRALTPATFSTNAFKESEDNVNQIRDFLDTLALAINSLSPSNTLPQSTIDLWKGNVVASRNSINGVLASISGAKDNLSNRETALRIAQEQLSIGRVGGRTEDVQAVEAGLKQATGALRAAQANFEKTIIRTPISGTINVFDIKQGDFVSVFQPIIVVSNNNALEITAFITDRDRDLIKAGATVIIEKRWPGVVTTVAPAVHEITKKVELKIGILDENTTLTKGQSARLDIAQTVDPLTLEIQPIIIPVSALKVGFDAVFVFTVDGNHQLIAHPVQVGPILGNQVVIESGVSPDLMIIKDARGLETGEKVTLSNF